MTLNGTTYSLPPPTAYNNDPHRSWADQSLMNDFFKDRWHRLPYTYNLQKRVFLHRPDLWNPNEIKIIHYTGGWFVYKVIISMVPLTPYLTGKPWQTETEWKEKDFEDNNPYLPIFDVRIIFPFTAKRDHLKTRSFCVTCRCGRRPMLESFL